MFMEDDLLLEDIIEDYILERLADDFDDDCVDKFLNQYDGSIITAEMTRHINAINELIENKIVEIGDIIAGDEFDCDDEE
jgi:hypothetical protein